MDAVIFLAGRNWRNFEFWREDRHPCDICMAIYGDAVASISSLHEDA